MNRLVWQQISGNSGLQTEAVKGGNWNVQTFTSAEVLRGKPISAEREERAFDQGLIVAGSDVKVEQLERVLAEADVIQGDHIQWRPAAAGTLADVLVQQWGVALACLCAPIWEEGLVLIPAAVLQSAAADWTLLDLLVRQGFVLPEGAAKFRVDWARTQLPLSELSPGASRCSRSQRQLIERMQEWLPPGFAGNRIERAALQAGCLQWLDELEESHSYSQSVQYQGEHRAADYWHAIMHRREPDPSNSKYWFGHVGSHPIFPELARQAAALAEMPEFAGCASQLGWIDASRWNPRSFVDCCSQARPGSDLERFAQRMQAIEMILLLRQTLLDARTG